MRRALRRSIRSLGIATLLGFALCGIAAADAIPGTATEPQHTSVRHAPVHGEPEIRNVNWQSTSERLHPGSSIDAVVTTSNNVGYVEARVRNWNVIFRQAAPGTFRLHYRVPLLPPPAIGSWQIEVIARSIDGVEVKRTFQFRYQYF